MNWEVCRAPFYCSAFLDGSFTHTFGKWMIREGNEVIGFPSSAQEIQAELTFTVSLTLSVAVASQGQIPAAETPLKKGFAAA